MSDSTHGRARGAAIWAWVFVVVSLLLPVLVAWYLYDSGLGRAGEPAVRMDVLRIGYAVEAPYAFLDADLDLKVTGESPETARLVAQRLGVQRIEWIQVPFANLIPELRAGRFDVVAAGLFITPERLTQVRFSRPTLQVTSALLTRLEDPEPPLDRVPWLLQPERRLAVIDGSVEMSRLRALGVPDARLVRASSAAMAAKLLREGEVAAFSLSLPTARHFAAQDAGRALRVSDLGGTAGSVPSCCLVDAVAFAFHPDQEALQRAWDKALGEVMASGQYAALLARFGFGEDDRHRPCRAGCSGG